MRATHFPAAGGPRLAIILVSLLSATAIGSTARAEDWPGFQGIDGYGKAAGRLPDSWTDRDYLWRLKLASSDVGSVAIADDQAFFLSFEPTRSALILHSLNVGTGKELWTRPFPIAEYHRHKRNTYASSTPTVAGDAVYIAYADPNHTWLRCFSFAGQERWSRDFGPWVSDHGFATSPRVAGGLVLLYDSQQAEQLEPGQSPSHERVIAVDAETGADRWITPLKATRTNYGIPAFYESPSGLRQAIAAGTGNGIFGIDADSGDLLWELPVLDKRSVGSPLVVGDLAIASCGSGGGGNYLVAVKIPDRRGEPAREAFRIDRAACYVPTPAIDGDTMTMISDNGIASRIRLPDGETVWSKRIGGNFGASPVIIGDKVLLVSLDGIATVIANSDRFEKLGEVDLGAGVGASPAAGDGKLILRVGDELRCLQIAETL